MKNRYYVLFVCSGNTCRSPLAEALFRRELKARGITGLAVSSAGTSAAPGVPAADYSREVARELGASLAGHRSRPVTARRIALADIILTMERKHRDSILGRWPGARGRVHVLPEFTGSGRERIPDPVGGPIEDYRDCGLALGDEISRVLPRLKKIITARRKT